MPMDVLCQYLFACTHVCFAGSSCGPVVERMGDYNGMTHALRGSVELAVPG